MAEDRIVSLAPSATETLRELDATNRLVGVTHHCPVDTTTVGGWLNPDFDAVEACDPDLVLTADPLQVEVRDELRDRGHRVVHVEPRTLGDVIESFATLGRAIGRPQEGHDLAWRARSRVERVRRLVADSPRPVVYCEEWSDPPTAAGNWVPDAVRAAGGHYPFSAPGERSTAVERSQIEDAEPEHVFLHVCGHGERSDPEAVLNREWSIPAIENEAVHVLDDSLLNQPSPRLIQGIEAMAATLHPGAVK
ncbi:iron complex transport system substrate-binding protein [Haladaptatus litoreus]|uniref:Iron complex transport system substrate-binding protein n=1 Tax=Haladaptatus litoreus TaxID=553468 RepID=A0A1N6VI31_9EURY|nr:cobalamin-binding protein [Haladaptatus litoreus]SIQ77408.1 iron complex transport system substrate-binding protein [Haladaptatus litoreus]